MIPAAGAVPAGPPGRIVVVGDLVTDVLVVHDGPVQPGSDTAAEITVTGGGQAANTAAWLAHAGSPVTLVAAVGDDPAGRERTAELSGRGVHCAVRVWPGVPTGSIVVLASADERTMITDRGAAVRLAPEDVDAAVRGAAGAVHLHLSGYPLLDPRSRPGGLAALAAARDRGLTTSVDAASAAPLRQVGAEAFQAWVRGTDLLLCNADEAAVLAGPGGPEEQAATLTSVARNVIVKRGGDGAVWAGRNPALWPAALQSAGSDPVLWSVAGNRVPVRDPTGAGDAFAAGLLRAWCAGAEPADALAAGAELGAAAVGRIGARP